MNPVKKFSYLLLMTFGLMACQKPEKEHISGSAAAEECKRMPAFIAKVGFNTQASAFSTSEKKTMGLCYIQMAPEPKTYQHPSWKSAGWLGPMIITPQGNILVAPVPVINVLENQPDKQNNLYIIDGNTQEMRPFISLPVQTPPTDQNAYGLLGLAYDCQKDHVFATSVMGSDRANERGVIYSIDMRTQKVIDQISGIDALGIGVNYLNQKKRCFFGKARSSEIWSVEVDKEGKFVGEPRLEISLADVGPRGDDKARKIRFLSNGDIQVQAVNFYFNLTAPAEKQETLYKFRYDTQKAAWVLLEVK